MLSALAMLQRVVRVLRHAVREEDFLPVLSAGVALVLIGTLSYAVGANWNPVDALYFSVAKRSA